VYTQNINVCFTLNQNLHTEFIDVARLFVLAATSSCSCNLKHALPTLARFELIKDFTSWKKFPTHLSTRNATKAITVHELQVISHPTCAQPSVNITFH
jgi:hypothetical protein